MKREPEEIIAQMNEWGAKGKAFVFVADFEGNDIRIFTPEDTSSLLWKTETASNFNENIIKIPSFEWESSPISFTHYQKGFDLIKNEIANGNSYLLNYTQPTPIKTNLTPQQILHASRARYKVFLKDEFICFSPEIFVRIENGIISSYPMKGTIDANLPNAREIILSSAKEKAEHHTIVDLIRNDLSLVADDVHVEKFRYVEELETSRGTLLQVSSKICGRLPENYPEKIGTIVHKMLPAGSISGAPKKKTVEIIKAAEQYERGFYTGIFGYFDGRNLDSCVLIRYIELAGHRQMIYKSGGGITYLSDARSEYEELVKKVYLPIV